MGNAIKNLKDVALTRIIPRCNAGSGEEISVSFHLGVIQQLRGPILPNFDPLPLALEWTIVDILQGPRIQIDAFQTNIFS
jgi:hypothetical protein